MHPLAVTWLDRVELLSRGLPRDERAELLADLREHLDVALSADPDTAEVDRVLARMGDPVDVVAAASEDLPPPAGPTTDDSLTSPRLTRAETITLVLLSVSGLLLLLWPLAVVAWIVGVVLLATRDRWRGVENVVALLLPFGFGMVWVGYLAFQLFEGTCATFETLDASGNLESQGAEACAGGAPAWTGWLTLAVPLGLVAASALGVWWLVRRIHTRYAVT